MKLPENEQEYVKFVLTHNANGDYTQFIGKGKYRACEVDEWFIRNWSWLKKMDMIISWNYKSEFEIRQYDSMLYYFQSSDELWQDAIDVMCDGENPFIESKVI